MKYIHTFIILALIFPAAPAVFPAEDQAAGENPPEIAGLIGDLDSSDPVERLRSRALLSEMGQEAGPPLLAALKTAEEDQADGLIEVLSFIRYREAAETVEKIWRETESLPLKLRAAEALCRFDHNYNRYQGYILSRVRSGEEEERLLAMQSLGYIGDRRVVDPLVGIFYDQSQPDRIRQAAVWDLAHTPVRESAEALVVMVNDPEIDWFFKEIIIAAIRRLAGQVEMAPIVSELLEEAQGLPGR